MKRRKRSVLYFAICLTLLGNLWGCSAVTGQKTESLEIDYVGDNGEITQEEVTTDSGNLVDWLKQKLSSDKKEADSARREMEDGQNPSAEGLQDFYDLTEGEGNGSQAAGAEETKDSSKAQAETETSDKSTQSAPSKNGGTDGQPGNEADNRPSDSDQPQNTVKKNTCTFTIRCDTAVANGMHQEAKWAGIVPASGCILPETTIEFEEGDTVFDLLCQVRDTYKLQMEYSGKNGGEYIKGINNLYEFDGGRWSGWMYCVNNWYPNYGCGQYAVKNGDVIEWNYTCDLGLDLDAEMPGAQEWKDTHE